MADSSPLNRLVVSRPSYTPRRTKLLTIAIILSLLGLTLFLTDFHSYLSLKKDFTIVQPSLPIPTATVTVTEKPPAVTVLKDNPIYYSSPSPAIEPVVFALLAWSESSGAEASLLIKSILMYITGPVELHIVCDSQAKDILTKSLNLLTAPTYDVKVRYYMPQWDQMSQRLDREGSLFTEHAAGIPGLMKLFLHEIIPVDKAIYVDTDAIFISDPRHLWGVFTTLKPRTAVVMSHHGDAGTEAWYSADRICSCVMLLDFVKLRKMRLMDSSVYRKDTNGPTAASPLAFKAMFGKPDPQDGRYHVVRLGDQGYWWAIIDFMKEIYEPLSFDFEVSSCLFEMYETRLGDTEIEEKSEMWRQGHVINTEQFGHIIRPKLLHFNCLHDSDKWWEWKGWEDPDNKLNRNWGSAIRYHANFKWIWLNRGPFGVVTTPPRLDMDIAETIFDDEMFAREHGIKI